MKSTSSVFRQKGMTIVELMVAVLIGLMAMYAVYHVYEGTERVKRNVASVGDAQIAGLYSIFLLEQSIHDAGFGMMNNSGIINNGALLASCDDTLAVGGDVGGGVGGTGADTNVLLSLRPLPVVIDRNGDFDDIYIFAGSSERVVPVDVVAGAAVTVGAAFGFRAGEVLVDTTVADCRAYRVAANAEPDPGCGTPPCTVMLNLQGVGAPAVGSRLIDLGIPVRHHFYVNNNTLLMAEWALNTNNGRWQRVGPPSPIVSGVVSLRAQYGIGPVPVPGVEDARGNTVIGPINQWVFAGDTDAGGFVWNRASIRQANLDTLRRIKAVRLSIIVRADEPDNNSTQPTAFTQFADCPGPTGTTCPASPTPSFAAGNRYRMYETVIPLKNVIWH